ncbi:uncharacterized protein LOC143230316 isoform X3 [Tachypleus tridentatus]|uniref:uncharacterized protein LOC143230316 isoform X3 n=1 Tax=Tachypleus tridentatus TaxID=6853 RepID=UPI003FD54A2A
MLLTLPSILVYKISEVKNKKQEQNKRKVAERQLTHLNHKIDKLLNKLEEQEPELAISREEVALNYSNYASKGRNSQKKNISSIVTK